MTCFPLAVSQDQFGFQALDAVIPIVYINRQTGQSQEVHAEIDSGASYSLAPASLASLIGLNLTSGHPLQLAGVGGGSLQTYLHIINLQIGTTVYEGVAVAIATIEDVPFLLGRINFWDLASIRIDDLNLQVCIDPLPGAPTVTGQAVSPSPGLVVFGLLISGLVFIGLYTLGTKP